MNPIVRHLIVCEGIQAGSRPERFTLVQVITNIHPTDAEHFPLFCRELCIMAICTECRGRGIVQLQVVDEETGDVCRESPKWLVAFANEPLRIIGFPFRLGKIKFPQPSVYMVQLLYNGDGIAEEPLRVAE